MGNVITEYSILLASKKKPVLHKQYGCGGTSIRRHGKEDAQVAERRCGLPCCYYEMWDWVSALFENSFAIAAALGIAQASLALHSFARYLLRTTKRLNVPKKGADEAKRNRR